MDNLNVQAQGYMGDNIYDFDNELSLTWYSNQIIKESNKEHSLLELGLGHGFTALNFSKFFNNHVVLDGSSNVISNFKKLHPKNNTKIIETYFETFNTDKKFDIIVMGFILEHVEHPLNIIKKFKKNLKKDGVMYIAVPNAEVMNRKLGNIAGLLDDMQELSEYEYTTRA